MPVNSGAKTPAAQLKEAAARAAAVRQASVEAAAKLKPPQGAPQQ